MKILNVFKVGSMIISSLISKALKMLKILINLSRTNLKRLRIYKTKMSYMMERRYKHEKFDIGLSSIYRIRVVSIKSELNKL